MYYRLKMRKYFFPLIAIMLSITLLISSIPSISNADNNKSNNYEVEFVNYDLGTLNMEFNNVPLGAKLYTEEELAKEDITYEAKDGCSWYLYYKGDGIVGDYGPVGIKDPEPRDGYEFKDWAAQGRENEEIYTVSGNTTFVARYAAKSQFIINLLYQYDNEMESIAAEISTVPYIIDDEISIDLPSSDELKGLCPEIKLDGMEQNQIKYFNSYIKNGKFTGKLDKIFLDNCKIAEFLSWDEEKEDYVKDKNGNVPINIPVTYSLADERKYKVVYHQEMADGVDYEVIEESEEKTVTGTNRVNLREQGLVKEYEHFYLNPLSEKDAENFILNSESVTVIDLYYDREEYHIFYRMNGGNEIEPITLKYGQTIPKDIDDKEVLKPFRQGYEFESLTYTKMDGTKIEELPETIEGHDIFLNASWTPSDTKVKIAYWLEEANGNDYILAGSKDIDAISGQTVGYDKYESNGITPEVSINDYITPEAMKEVGIDDGEYFALFSCDSTDIEDPEEKFDVLKTAKGDGTTVINLGYKRKEYSLTFHIGKIEDAPGNQYGWHKISTGYGNSNSQDYNNFTSGYDGWIPGAWNKGITINGEKYTPEKPYELKAKYGQFISSMWPVANNITNGEDDFVQYNNNKYRLYTWATHYMSPYHQTPNRTNKNIQGVYPYMSKELIVKPNDERQPHHLTAYWESTGKEKIHKYYFEVVPGVDIPDGKTFTIDDFPYDKKTSIQGIGNYETLKGKKFYLFNELRVRTGAELYRQNPPQYPNLDYQYGCHNGIENNSGEAYFFYTYKDYTLTYEENNDNVTTDTDESVENKVPFHYVGGKLLKDVLEADGYDYDYQPEQKFICQYGNEHTWKGWYKDPEGQFPVDWETISPDSNMTIYGMWEKEKFTVTLNVPNGKLPSDVENKLKENYKCDISETVDSEGQKLTTYTLSDVEGGSKASDIIDVTTKPISDVDLVFNYWGREKDGENEKFLFDESQIITENLTLNANWKSEYNGAYTVRYLTAENPNNDLEMITIDGKNYYRLSEDETTQGVVVGSSVTLEPKHIDKYLPKQGSISNIIDSKKEDKVQTFYNFVYDKISGTSKIKYQVHYVLDKGENYGRTAPSEDVEKLLDSKEVTIDLSKLQTNSKVSEKAQVIPGYSPKYSWNNKMILTAEESQNHMYIYYIPNEKKVNFTAKIFFQKEDGTYTKEDSVEITGSDKLGKPLTSKEYVDNFEKYITDPAAQEKMKNRSLDQILTQEYILLGTDSSKNQLFIYMKNGPYTLSYNLDGGNGDGFSNGVYEAGAEVAINNSTPTKEGFTFIAWEYNNKAYAQGDKFIMPAENVELKAIWKEDSVPSRKAYVIYELNGGSGGLPEKTEYEVGEVVTVSSIEPIKENSIFKGWLYSIDKTTIYKSNDKFIMPNENVTLTAQWQDDTVPVEEYEVTYDLNGGNGKTSETKKYKVGDVVIVDNKIPTHEILSFVGWKSSYDGKVYQGNDEFEMPNQDVTLTAQWHDNTIPTQYKLIYHSNNGENKTIEETYDENTPVSIKDNTFSYEGYKFVSWNTEQDGSGTKYSPKDTLTIIGNTNLYAQWEKDSSSGGGNPTKQYELVYETNGGNLISSEKQNTIWTKSFDSLPIPTKTGYKFEGWYYDKELTNKIQSDININKSKITIYAKWSKVDDGSGGNNLGDPDKNGVSQTLNTKDHFPYMTGYPDGSFGPENYITRAEVAQIFYNLLLDKNVNHTVFFEDVDQSMWYANAINTLASLNMIKGMGDNNYQPERPITRAEFTAIARQFAKVNIEGKNNFIDVAESDWFYNIVVSSAGFGWINGYEDGTFKPYKTITRAEAAVIVNALLGRMADKDFIDNNPKYNT